MEYCIIIDSPIMVNISLLVFIPTSEVKAHRKPVPQIIGWELLQSGLLTNFRGVEKLSLTNVVK